MTLPALRQEVQTLRRFGVTPASPTRALTRWMFGFQRRLVRRCECEMLWPKPGPLPQTSQLAATGDLLDSGEKVLSRGPTVRSVPEAQPHKRIRGHAHTPKRRIDSSKMPA